MLRRNEGTVVVNREELAGYIRWYTQIRWYILATLATSGIVGEFLALGVGQINNWNFLIVGGTAIANVLLSVLVRRRDASYRFLYGLAYVQILIDITVASYLVGFYGGGQSRALIIYAIPIVISGALFGRAATFFAAYCSSLAYVSILLLHHAGVIQPQLVISPTSGRASFLVPLLFYTSVFFILAIISDFLSSRIQKREKELAHQEMVSLASHQIRTPATAVKSTLSTLLDSYGDDLSQEQRELIAQAYQENEYELELIDNMLVLGRLESGEALLQLKNVNVSGMIEKLAANWGANIASRHQTLTINQPAEEVWHSLDPGQMRSALDNLVSNASKYTPEGGSITLAMQKDGDHLVLTVADTGIGITEQDQQDLFTKYFRSIRAIHDNIPGTGLGLYFVKRIVDAHHGSITVSSKPDSGTIVTISLPGAE